MRPWYLSVAGGLSLVACWVFPAGLEDGFYMVTLPDPSLNDSSQVAMVTRGDMDGEGNNLLRRSRWTWPWAKAPHHDQPGDHPSGDDSAYDEFKVPVNLPLRNMSKHHDLTPVPVSSHFCVFNSPRFLTSDYSQARDSLARYCARYLVPSRTVHISVSANGQAGAFVCNFSFRNQVCSGREFRWVENNWLNIRCGNMRPGQVEISSWLKWYGRAYPGMDLCQSILDLGENVWYGTPTENQTRNMDDEDRGLDDETGWSD
ncbi:Uncharacterized protein TCAP_03852 [Tolypocladium capitatum]|uniref:Uncharacterized protein n=1 Tax=Tolypocladium capitatum TaxID=45235 RepID=A0A2K3QF95_9HYPO|nr:Uncharacterized protein TCAP_03852 [Tolypocladium capitatum]